MSTDTSIVTLLETAFTKNAKSCSVKFKSQSFSYQDLNNVSNAIASYFLSLGAIKGSRIVVCLDKGFISVATIVGVLRAGMTFVPIHHATPQARLQFIAKDVSATFVITTKSIQLDYPQDHTSNIGPMVILENKLNEVISESRLINSRMLANLKSINREDIAYINYTSGTTGKPKGARICHGGLIDKFFSWQKLYSLNQDVRCILQLAKLGFDVFTGDLIKSLCSGGKLVLCSDEDALFPDRVCQLIKEGNVDYMEVVPSSLRAIASHLVESKSDLKGMKIINCGADRWSAKEYLEFKRITKVDELFNTYGVTEATIESSFFIDKNKTLTPKCNLPIGLALDDSPIIIVDQNNTPIPDGNVGEIVICGDSVSTGYVNNNKLNTEKFFTFSDSGVKIRCYKTGDIGVINRLGQIELAGRKDNQIKIDGNRIDPEEVELLIEKNFEVKKAIVGKKLNENTLYAYIQPLGSAHVELSILQFKLRKIVPEYLIPKSLEILSNPPLTSNGKVDREMLFESNSVTSESKKNTLTDFIANVRDLDQLISTLHSVGINVESLVNEFVKPNSEFAILIEKPSSEFLTSEIQNLDFVLDVVVLLESFGSLKRKKTKIYGSPISYSEKVTDSYDNLNIQIMVNKILVKITFLISISEFESSASRADNKYSQTLHLLASSWIIKNTKMVDKWKKLCSRA